jgi:hypothetical protein
MLLNEFFGKPLDVTKSSKEGSDNFTDELFWYIIDHDKLHKDYVIPLAKKIKAKPNSTETIKEFMPMIEKGCKEFYAKKNMTGKLGKLFPKELREELCERVHDHFRDDILQDKYNLGQ